MNPVCPKCNCTANQIGPEHYECPYCGKKFTAKIAMPNGNPMSDNQQPKLEQSQSNSTLSNSTSSNWWPEVKNFDPETTINEKGESKFLSWGILATILLLIMNYIDCTDSSPRSMRMAGYIIFCSAIILWCSIKVVRYGKFKVLAITNIILAAGIILGSIHDLLLVFSDDYYYFFMNI